MLKKLEHLLFNPLSILNVVFSRLPYFRFIRETGDYQNRVDFIFWFKQKVLNWGGNRKAYWPVHWTSKVYDVEKIIVGIDAYPGIMNGCYIQGRGGIEIGDYTQIAPNVAIVSSNHDIYDSRKHIDNPVKIGKYCWIGANAAIMPGVVLGDFTVVGAGAVVTKSFPEGHCVIGGVPAKLIKPLEKGMCITFRNVKLYNGYIPSRNFQEFRKKNLKT